jgi:ketosteroid isomerase-like protein
MKFLQIATFANCEHADYRSASRIRVSGQFVGRGRLSSLRSFEVGSVRESGRPRTMRRLRVPRLLKAVAVAARRQERDTGRAMSQENLELIRAGFAAHNRGDLDALTQVYDPDVVFETLLLGTHHGNEAIRLIYEENQKTLSGYTVDPIELIDDGDQVVAVAQVNGVGPASQIAMEDRDRFAFLFTIKNGRVVREQAFRNREEALEAAGLSE